MASVVVELATASTAADKLKVLERLITNNVEGIQLVAQTTDLLLLIAQALKEHRQWASNFPGSIEVVIRRTFSLREVRFKHTSILVDMLLETYSRLESDKPVICLSYILFNVCKTDFLNHPSLFYNLQRALFSSSKQVQSSAWRAFVAVTDNCEEWQLKVIKNQSAVLQLVTLDGWDAIFNLSQHPDAKMLLPPNVLEKAQRFQDSTLCKRICAVLCNESDAISLLLDDKFVEEQASQFRQLLAKQHQQGKGGFNLLDICLPFVNLSINDANKEKLGKHLIPSLLSVVAIKESSELTSLISLCLTRGKRECAKTLWNLSFSELNRSLIEKAGGIALLKTIQSETSDEVLRKNIEGVLFMFASLQSTVATPKREPTVRSSLVHKKSHIMISYNWSHQNIATRLAATLQSQGYSVWLDIQQMKGSTLGSMAEAIEGSDMMLLCISQKYKDSPNCRLEGEYCMKRGVPFIPLMVQQGYRPDGWLGLIMGSRLWHNFTDENDWDSKMSALLKEIGNTVKGVKLLPSLPQGENPTPSPPSSTPNTNAWTLEEVLEWLKSEDLDILNDSFVAHKIDGFALLQLKSSLSQPPLYLHFLEAMKVHTIPVGYQLRLYGALKKLVE